MYEKFITSELKNSLTADQLEFFINFFNTNRNLLVTGSAGTGKSFVLKTLSDICEEHSILLSKTASTGVAALNIQGQTVHSFVGIGLANFPIDILVKKVRKNKKAFQRVKSCRVLVIDEISMISGELLDKIYNVFQLCKGFQPRYIFLGDFLQLPFVSKEDKLFCFESKAWTKINPLVTKLTTIVRQGNESDYAKNLERVRSGDKAALKFFDHRIVDECPKDTLMAFCRNVDVDEFNHTKVLKLKGDLKSYKAVDFGQEPYLSNIQRNCLAPEILKLKVGAQVMLLKNMPKEDLVNGSIGIVTKLNNDSVEVDFDGNIVQINKDDWRIEEGYIDEKGKIKQRCLASRSQIPLKVAYSVTIHRLQGLTVDKICVDLNNCFESGQFYTALSRARTIEGLHILNFRPSSLIVSQKCLDFMNAV